MPLVEQELPILPEHMTSPPVFSGVHVTLSLVICVCFVDRCLSYYPFVLPWCCLSFDLRILIFKLFLAVLTFHPMMEVELLPTPEDLGSPCSLLRSVLLNRLFTVCHCLSFCRQSFWHLYWLYFNLQLLVS